MVCPVCQKDVAPDAKFCLHCGTSLSPAEGPGFTPVAGYTPPDASGASPEPSYTPVSGSTPPSSAPPGSGYSATYNPPPAGYPPPQYPPQSGGYPPPAGFAAPGLSNNAASAIAYLTIIPAIVFLVLEPYNKVPLVRFHSFQSIGLFLVAVLLHIVITTMQVAMHFMVGFFLFSMIHMLLSLGLFIVWLITILKASKGEWYKLPVIGDFAEKQARG